jgi:energy-coupling factor transporter ATP-binding protein EcfA2
MNAANNLSGLMAVAIALGAAVAICVIFWRIYLRLKRRAQIEREKVQQELEELKFALEKKTITGAGYEKLASTLALAEQNEREGAIPDIPSDLVSALASQNCILFAGGGISAQAGLPTWGLGLRQILDRAARLDPSQDWDTLRKGLEQGEMSGVSELIRARLPGEALAKICDEVFGGPAMRTSPMHSVLGHLPFTGVLTTSWDRTLDAAFEARHPNILSPTDSQQFGEIIREGKFFLLKLYGDPRKLEEFLFTPEEYRKATYENESFAKCVHSIYLSNTIIFAGASLEGIHYFLAGLRIHPDGGRRHFAIVPKQLGMEIEAERFRTKYGIELLTYQPTPGFPELAQFFENLRARVNALPVPVTSNELVPLTIDRIRLENIGSFENLDLTFNNTWNVLLGNNGCGKSTILKAIALCLCGDDNKAKDVAGYLLRSQTSRGTIEIWVGPQKYTTTLIRDGRTINLKFEQVTPLQAKRWVVLGFPPLRGISQQNPKGPSGSDGSPNPEVSDLLPLISGTVDTRLDSLKQWIVNLAMRAEPGGKNSAGDQERCNRMINSFFDLLGELTPGVSCEFKEIDRTSWRIIVTTPDGAVPLDSISQGTTSVYGWIGTLLQRMHEIYRHSPEPEKEPALVLVDEIDAHMHPEWQQMIVPLLQRKFPRLQVIATTHSPLIVGGMPVSQITRFIREKSGKVTMAKIDEDMTLGRTDQILTGDLFGLGSTLSLGEEGEKLKAEYEHLLGITNRTKEQEERYAKLHISLESMLPAAGAETKLERRTQALVDTILTADYSAKNVGALKKKLLSKTREVAKSMGWTELQ